MFEDIRRQYRDTVDGFFFQHDSWTCWPTCIKNILLQLNRDFPSSPNPSLSTLNSTIGSFHGFPENPAMVAELINEKILKKKGFKLFEDNSLTYEDLQSILSARITSLPIVALSPDYFTEIESIIGQENMGFRIHGKPEMDHTIIILEANDKNIVYFEPWTPFLHLNNANSEERAIFKLGKGLFLQLWSDTLSDYRWAMWVEKSLQKTIPEFGTGELE